MLIEHNSLAFTPLALCNLLNWSKKNGWEVIVVDVLDTLKPYREHAELSGISASVLDEVEVIKLGGRVEVGNVIERISVVEESAMEKELARLFEDIYSKRNVINATVGIEKLFVLYSGSLKDVLSLVDFMVSFVGDKRRKSVFFLNVDMVEKAQPTVLPMLEEFATTVIRTEKNKSFTKFEVLKSINPELEGFEEEISVDDCIEFLKKLNEKAKARTNPCSTFLSSLPALFL